MAAKPEPGTAPKRPLVSRQVELMTAMYICDKKFHDAVASQLKPQKFPRDFVHFGALVGIVNECCEEHGKLPALSVVIAEAESWLSTQPDLDSDSIDELNRTIVLAEELTKEVRATSRPKALEYVQRLLHESVQLGLRHALTLGGNAELPKLLAESSLELEAISSISSGSLGQPFPDKLEDAAPLHKESTGCSFLDLYMRGGQAAGEVYGFCAPYGVCKTTVACQIAANRVLHEQAKAKSSGSKLLPVVYFVSYEEQIEGQLMPRFLSYVADVDKEPLEDSRWSSLSRRSLGDYKDYERKRYREQLAKNIKVPGEYERVLLAKDQLNANLRIIDFTGNNRDLYKASCDFVDGIVNVIAKDQQMNGNPGVSLVLIDYASAAADRWCSYYNKDPDRFMRHLIGRMPMRVKSGIAARWRCPVWVFQQMTTTANALRPGVAPKITDVSEAKNFFENCAFGFMVGTKTNDHLAVLTNVKQRRAEKRDDIVIRIDGRFSRVISTEGAYKIDRGRIVSAADANRVAENVAVEKFRRTNQEFRLDDIGFASTRRH